MSTPLLRPNFAAWAPAVQATLERLYANALAVDPAVRERARHHGLTEEHHAGFYSAMTDAYLPVSPELGALLYLIVRMTRARRVVEFGTSFGISTIFLAAALHDQRAGALVTTELYEAKAAAARRNLVAAGVGDRVELRVGDARDTLRADEQGPIDVVFLDGPKSHYRAVCELLATRFEPGTVLVSDNSELDGAADYLAYIRDPANGWIGASIETSIETAGVSYHWSHEILMKRA